MRVRVKGLKRYTDRLGYKRLYHRKSGTPIDPNLTGQEIALEVARLDALHAEKTAKPGTLGGLLASYRAAPRFTDLAPRTRADYQKIMDYLQAVEGTPMHLLTTSYMAKLRDKTVKKKGAGFTNHMLALLSSAFKHGKEYDLADENPVTGLTKAKMAADRRRPNRPWTGDERKNVPKAAPPHLKLPIMLARVWGIRRGDIVKLPRSAYRDGWLEFRAGKNHALIRLPVIGDLKVEMDAAIAAAPAGDSTLLCLNSRGKPWTEGGLSHVLGEFFEECRKHGIMGPGGSIHGLRHSVAAELRAAGYTAEDRKLVLGHDTDEMAEHYSASADMSGVLIDMANVLQSGPKRERGLANRRRKND